MTIAPGWESQVLSCSIGGSFYNVARQEFDTKNGVEPGLSQAGTCDAANGADPYISEPAGPGTEFIVLCVLTPRGLSGIKQIFACDNVANPVNRRLQFRTNGTSLEIVRFNTAVEPFSVSLPIGITDRGVGTVVGWSNGLTFGAISPSGEVIGTMTGAPSAWGQNASIARWYSRVTEGLTREPSSHMAALRAVLRDPGVQEVRRALQQNPWQLFRADPVRIYSLGAEGVFNLDIFNALHAHTAPTIDLSALLNLVTTDGTHTHTADSVTLGSAHALVPASATHAHSAEALDLSAGLALTVADALHAQQADSPTLTAAHTLNVAASLHAHTADQLPVSAALTLAVAAALHAQSAERRQLTYPGLFAQDDFFGSSADTELSAHNAQWVKHPSYSNTTTVTASAWVIGPASGSSAYYRTEVPSSADYAVRAKIKVLSTGASGYPGPAGRMSTSQNTMYVARYGNGNWQLFRALSGTFAILAQQAQSFANGTELDIELRMQGDKIQVYGNGSLVIDYTDTTPILDVGRAGVRLLGNGSAGSELDNFAAHTLSGVAADLSTNNALHAHTAQTPTLGSAHTIATSNAAHGQVADTATLSAAHSLIASNAAHTHVAGSPTLDVGLSLAPADAVHTHLAESLALSAAHNLVVADAQHDHSASTVALSAVLNLLVDAAAHAHTAGNLTLDTANAAQLVTQDATHAQAAEQLALSTALTLVMQSAIHTHGADAVTLSANLGLSISGSMHAHTADNVSAASGISLTVQSAFHAHVADGLALDAALSLAIHDALHAHYADALTLTTLVNLLVSDAIHAHQASNPTLYLPVPAAELLRKSVFVRLAELVAVTRLSRQGATTRVSDERAFVRVDDPMTNFTRH